jgi:GNAT superfamily N-acetyltransferase
MSAIDYDNRRFAGVENSAAGQVDAATRFHYHQTGDTLWGAYQGGAIRAGTLVGTVAADGSLQFTYQHVDTDGALRCGRCRSTPEVLPDGRLRLHERWVWTSGDQAGVTGESIVEEIVHAPDDLAPCTYTRGEYTISTDPDRLDLNAIHDYIVQSYWAKGRPREVMARALRQSLNFGLYHGAAQVGLARIVTDYATYVYLCDVYVLEEHRGQGLGKWLVETVVAYPPLQGARRWMLATRDAHGLYAQYGFAPLAKAESHMELVRPAPWVP